ncbi:hypothetical protein [Stygiolobus caldivivus]|nr:hypothetical protein [Stygiolobus caldivivus]
MYSPLIESLYTTLPRCLSLMLMTLPHISVEGLIRLQEERNHYSSSILRY